METAVKYGKLWIKGDINGFLGLFTGLMANIIVLSALLMYGVGLPPELVIGKAIPGVGLCIALGNIYYAYMAVRMSKKEKRNDVTALPYGIGVGHMFIVSFMVIGPVYWTTQDAELAWFTGMAWCFLEAFVEIAGAFCAPFIRRVTPKAAMLGTIAGLSLSLIAMKPLALAAQFPVIAFSSIALLLIGFFGKKRMPLGIPATIWMIILGIIIGWATGYMKLDALQQSLSNVRFSLPIPHIPGLIKGLGNIGPFLLTALPMGIGNAIETLNNIEAAKASGDDFDVKEAMIVNGIGSLTGSLFGSPVPTCVYLGHTGWKYMGAGAGYSLATGIATLFVCATTLIPVFMAVVPLPAIMPMLLYIGVVMASVAFQESPKKHYPAIVLGILPWFANWVITIINNTLQVAGIQNVFEGDIIANLEGADVLYRGLLSLSNGAVVISMVFAALTVFIIDGKLKNAVVVSLIGAVLSFFGFMHASSIGFNMAPQEMIGYLIVAAILVVVHLCNAETESNSSAMQSAD